MKEHLPGRIISLASAAVVSTFACLSAAGETYHDICTNIAAALQNNNSIVEPSFTNRLFTYSNGATSSEKATIDVALAVSMFKIFENSNDDEAMRLSSVLCTNVINSAGVPTRSWQKSAASAVYATTFAIDGQYDSAYAVCTNALANHLCAPLLDDESAVWAGVSHCHFVDGLSVTNALNLCAALSALMENPLVDCSAYTNDLPIQALQKVIMAVGD